MSPYKIVFDREPPQLIRYEAQVGDTPSIQEQLQLRDAVLESLKANIKKTQLKMKAQADNNKRDVEYNVGHFIYVKLQPYHQHSLRLTKNQKFSIRYFGPFPIVERIGQDVYNLQLPLTTQIHPVFHVSVLKKCEGRPQSACVPKPLLLDEKGYPLQPQVILDTG